MAWHDLAFLAEVEILTVSFCYYSHTWVPDALYSILSFICTWLYLRIYVVQTSSEELKVLWVCTSTETKWYLLSHLHPLIWLLFWDLISSLEDDAFARQRNMVFHRTLYRKQKKLWFLCSELMHASLCSWSITLGLHIYSSVDICCFLFLLVLLAQCWNGNNSKISTPW